MKLDAIKTRIISPPPLLNTVNDAFFSAKSDVNIKSLSYHLRLYGATTFLNTQSWELNETPLNPHQND
jgi:hypothetical protein